MSYKSKYTGQQVENILDKVNEGNIGTIKASFSVKTLLEYINTTNYIELNTEFIDTIKVGGKIIIKYNDEDNEEGYYTLTGHITSDDKLSFSLPIDNGRIIYCNNVSIKDSSNIQGNQLNIIDLKNKQETLVNEANIKSINGDSILGSGNLIVKHNVVDTPLINSERIAVRGGNVYNITRVISSLYITIQNSQNDKDYEEISISFTTGDSVSSNSITIVTQTGIPLKWANGINPLNLLIPNTSYELSIAIIKRGETIRYNGILVPFYTE